MANHYAIPMPNPLYKHQIPNPFSSFSPSSSFLFLIARVENGHVSNNNIIIIIIIFIGFGFFMVFWCGVRTPI